MAAVLRVTNGEEAVRFPNTNGEIWEATYSTAMAGRLRRPRCSCYIGYRVKFNSQCNRQVEYLL